MSHLLIVLSAGPPPFGSSWVKRYCTFVKEQKILHMLTFDHRSGGKNVSCVQSSRTFIAVLLRQRGALICFHTNNSSQLIFFFLLQGETESVTLKSCVRKTTDMLDRRFCLELDITDRYVTTVPLMHAAHVFVGALNSSGEH